MVMTVPQTMNLRLCGQKMGTLRSSILLVAMNAVSPSHNLKFRVRELMLCLPTCARILLPQAYYAWGKRIRSHVGKQSINSRSQPQWLHGGEHRLNESLIGQKLIPYFQGAFSLYVC